MVHSACTPERKAELLKLIADELIVLDQSRERALRAEQRISEWRAEYDEQAPGPAPVERGLYENLTIRDKSRGRAQSPRLT
jgi:hypothetical protein